MKWHDFVILRRYFSWLGAPHFNHFLIKYKLYPPWKIPSLENLWSFLADFMHVNLVALQYINLVALQYINLIALQYINLIALQYMLIYFLLPSWTILKNPTRIIGSHCFLNNLFLKKVRPFCSFLPFLTYWKTEEKPDLLKALTTANLNMQIYCKILKNSNCI